MRYLTRRTLHARLASSHQVLIYIPPKELIETTPSESNCPEIRVTWRGQLLDAELTEVNRAAAIEDLTPRAATA